MPPPRQRRLLLLLCACALCVRVHRADAGECSAAAYLFNGGEAFAEDEAVPVDKRPASFCRDFKYGGGESCNEYSGWTSPYTGATCRYKNGIIGEQRSCECTTRSCGNGYCYCTSAADAGLINCYATTVPCARCAEENGLVRFRQGCGCVDCRQTAQRGFYDNHAHLYNLDYRCSVAPYSGSYACGPGTCQVCPEGARCDGFNVVQCLPGYFQKKKGQGMCQPCAVNEPNTYLDPKYDHLDRAVCDPKLGWKVNMSKCDACTDRYGWKLTATTADGGPTQRCPEYRRDYGLYDAPDPAQPSRCRPCNMCAGKLYARPDAEDNYCVTDRSRARCVEMYNANPNINGYYCNADGCYRGGENVTVGAMPWLAGHERTLSPHRYVPGDDINRGLLPWYRPCGGGTAQAYLAAHYHTAGFAPRAQDADQVARLNARPWYKDCDTLTTRECLPGYYAQVEAAPDGDGLRLLRGCGRCEGGVSRGGLAPDCACGPGRVTFAALRAHAAAEFDSLTRWGGGGAPVDEQACVSCLDAIAWRHTADDGTLFQEALACTGTNLSSASSNAAAAAPFRRCSGAREYVARETHTCAVCSAGVAHQAAARLDPSKICTATDITDAAEAAAPQPPPREIPLRNRTGCMRCPPGTRIAVVAGTDVHGCVRCAPNTFQPAEGQCACRPKRAYCPPGQMLVRDFATSDDPLADFQCAPCKTGCGPNQITISAPGGLTSAGAGNNNTCNGQGGYFFSCYNGQGTGTGLTLSAGHRLEYPPSTSADGSVADGAYAVLAQCHAAALPPHSVFVSQTMNAPGAQCYFACLHGVQPRVADAYHDGIRDHVRAWRRDLEAFLPDSNGVSVGSGGSGGSGGRLERIVVPAVWGYRDAAAAAAAVAGGGGGGDNQPSRTDGSWTVNEPWTVAGAAAASVWQNTFLFEETFLAAFFAHDGAAPLCMPPEQAYTWSCPPGFAAPSVAEAAANGVSCALTARTHLYRILSAAAATPPPVVLSHFAVVSPTTAANAASATAMCVAPDTTLARFRLNCVTACLDQQLLTTLDTMRQEIPFNSVWFARLGWLAYFAQSTHWYRRHGYFNPYQMEGVQTRVPLSPAHYFPTTSSSAAASSTVAITLSSVATPAASVFFGVNSSSSSIAAAATATATTSAATTSGTALPLTTTPSSSGDEIQQQQQPQCAATRCTWRAAASANGVITTINTFRYSTADHGADDANPHEALLPLPAEGDGGGLAACIPCTYGVGANYGENICGLFTPRRYFSNELCLSPPEGTAELTAAMVCMECPHTTDDLLGTLIPIAQPPSAEYKDWWTARYNAIGSSPEFGTVVNGVQIWNAVKCRYRCAEYHTSNNASPEAYRKRPCVPCVALSSLVCPNSGGGGGGGKEGTALAPAFVDVPPGATCGQPGNYVPYAASCSLCEAALQDMVPEAATGAMVPKFVFSLPPDGGRNPVASPGECVALCNPAVFHTHLLGTDDAAPITTPIPYGSIDCRRCDTNPDAACQGRCGEGRYHNASRSSATDCPLCTTAPCPPGQGQYRERCFAGAALRDALCLPRPSEALRNPSLDPDADTPPLLRAAIQSVAGQVVRRWLSARDLADAPNAWAPYVAAAPSPHPEQVALACVNNHAWIDAGTGRSPFAAADAAASMLLLDGSGGGRPYLEAAKRPLFCLPCSSKYIANGGDPRLYAVWHAANITEALPAAATPGSALASLTGDGAGNFPGGCYTCPGYGVRAVAAGSNAMCELLPGFTDGAQGIASVVNLTVTSVFSVGEWGAYADAAVVFEGEVQLGVPVADDFGQGSAGTGGLIFNRRRLLSSSSSAANNNNNNSSSNRTAAPTTRLGQLRVVLAAAADTTNNNDRQRVQRVVQRIPVVRPPVFGDTPDHFACCGADDACRQLRGTAYYGLNTQTGGGVRAPCAPLQQTTTQTPHDVRRRRALLQMRPTEFEAATEAWFTNRTGAPPASACHGGTYKPQYGDGPCYYCPPGASTTGPDYAGASSRKQCACLPGFYAARLPPPSSSADADASDANFTALDRALLRCAPCPNGTYRSSSEQNNDTACSRCPARMRTPGTGSAYCTCMPGTYPNRTYAACVPCEPDFYCDGNAKTRCPERSRSAPGAAARGHCVCDPATHYGDLSLPGGACLPRPPGYACTNSTGGGTGAIGCGCAAGWTVAHNTAQGHVRCQSPCAAGQYIELQPPPSQNLKACVPCAADTYAAEGTLLGACTPCPVGRGTRGRTGMTAAANCTCASGVASNSSGGGASCDGCAGGHYFDLLEKRCLACPAGWSSPPNTIGRIHCVCPPGAYASGVRCAPCPLHTFSRSLGLTCTPCPKGCVTEAVGQTSLAQCRCGRL